MNSDTWLRSVERIVCAQLEHVKMFWADDDTLTLALHTRGIVLHVTRGVAFMAPSFVVPGPNTCGLQDRVQHLDPAEYAIEANTVLSAYDAIITHLRPCPAALG